MSARPGVAQASHKKTRQRSANWQAKANCRDANPNIFDTLPERYPEAVLVCQGCPVIEECKAERRGADGVWGGKIYRQQKSRMPSVRDYLLEPHGTDAARRRHHRAGEPLCARCQQG